MDWQLNATGNFTQKVLEGAKAADVLTAALRAEELQLKKLQTLFARESAGGAINLKTKASIDETSKRVANLRAQLSKKAPTGLEEGSGKLAILGTVAAGAAVAVVALGAAFAKGATSAITFAFGLADAARSARLLNDAADIAAGTHRQLTAVIGQLGREVPLGRDKLAEMARELRILRLDSRQTQLAVSAAAFATSALGDSAGRAIIGIAESSKAARKFTLGVRDLHGEYSALKGTGLTRADVFTELAKALGTSVQGAEQAVARGQVKIRQGLEALDAAMRKKFGGTVRAQMLSLGTQFAKFKEDIGDIFGEIDIEPFLGGLRAGLQIFSKTTAEGRAMRTLVTGAFSAISKVAGGVFPLIRAGFLGAAIAALELYVAIKPAIKELRALFGAGQGDTIKTVFEGAQIAVRIFAGLLTAVATAAGVIAIPFVVAYKVIKNVITSIGAELKNLGGISLVDTGIALMKGLAKGIYAGVKEAVLAITDAGSAILTTFKGILKISSPSKVFAQYGKWTAEGYSIGIESEAPRAQRAVSQLVQGGGDTVTNTSSQSSSVTNYNTFPIQVAFTENDLERMLTRILSRIGREATG